MTPKDPDSALMQDDIAKQFQVLDADAQLEFMNFSEHLQALRTGDSLEFHGATFWKGIDGQLSAAIPSQVLQAYNARFPSAPLRGELL